jgi:DNA invertase Pin-like site-specific DNA recombinase
MGRSVRHLIDVVGELDRQGVELVVLAQGIDITSAGGRLLFRVLARDGRVRRRSDLREHLRRPGRRACPWPGRGAAHGSDRGQAAGGTADARAGSTVTEIATTIGVGRATLYRHLDGLSASPN